MQGRLLSKLAKYVVAIGSVAVAFVANLLTSDLEQTREVLFIASVAISAWWGGIGPGLVATVLSTLLLDYFFISEIHSVDIGPSVFASLVIFVLVAVLINSLDAVRRRLELVLRVQNQRKSEFMAVLAHELRNFLAPIPPALGIFKLSARGDETVEQTCATVETQVRNMTRLINDMLDAARINQKKLKLDRERLDLRSIVSAAVEAAAPLIDGRGHHLAVLVPPGPLRLDGDRTRLEQVVVNLLSNAAKYTDAGGRIELAVERRGGEWVVHVRDNGQGIPPELTPHVFDLFMQVENGSTGGLGVGLNLVRGIVEMHGGSVAAASAGLGRGSDFVVRLPAASAEEPIAAGDIPAPLEVRFPSGGDGRNAGQPCLTGEHNSLANSQQA